MKNKILIAVPCKPTQARYVDFFRALEKVKIPEGFEVIKELFPGWFPHYNRNEAVALAKKLDCSHIFFVDDDVILPPNTLIQLLKPDVDIISANMLYRCPPFNAYMYKQTDEKGRTSVLELQGRGITTCDSIGFGAVLIKTKLFEQLEEPYFALNDTIKTDDLFFSWKLKQLGIPIFYHLEVLVGHVSEAVVYPSFENGEWVTKIVIMGSVVWTIPAARIQSTGNWGIGKDLNIPNEPDGRHSNKSVVS
jgi:hypothetical protein